MTTATTLILAAGCCGGGPAAPPTFTVTELGVGGGELPGQLSAEVARALELGRNPFVEVYADWCGPCKALRDSLGDPLMVDAFEGTYIIKLDYDAWGEKLEKAGLGSSAVPVFFELDGRGKPTGRSIDGGAWGENIPVNMAPPLKAFFGAE